MNRPAKRIQSLTEPVIPAEYGTRRRPSCGISRTQRMHCLNQCEKSLGNSDQERPAEGKRPLTAGARAGRLTAFGRTIHRLDGPSLDLQPAALSAVGTGGGLPGVRGRFHRRFLPNGLTEPSSHLMSRLLDSPVMRHAVARRTQGQPGRVFRCLTRRPSSQRTAARTCRMASAPSRSFQNISVPFAR